MELITFILVSVGVIIIPGPNVLVIASTSLSHGTMRGLQTVAGTSMAMIIQLAIAAVGTTWFVASLAQGFQVLKWLGIAYLAWLGINHLVNLARHSRPAPTLSGAGSFGRGFVTSLTNPKTILFFGAFLPQFVATDAATSYLLQICLLSMIFWLLAVILDSAYALMAGRMSTLLAGRNLAKIQDGISGTLYLGASALLGLANKQ